LKLVAPNSLCRNKWALSQWVTEIDPWSQFLPTFHQHFTSISPTFYQRFTNILPTIYQHFTNSFCASIFTLILLVLGIKLKAENLGIPFSCW